MKMKHCLIGTAWPLSSMLVGLAAVYIAERALHDTPHAVVLGLGVLGILAAGIMAGLRVHVTDGDRRRAYGRVFVE